MTRITEPAAQAMSEAYAGDAFAGATPGPWSVEDPLGPEQLWIVDAAEQVYDWKCLAIVCDDQDEEDDGRPRVNRKERNANASLIVAAVNSFDDTRALLRDLIQQSDRAGDFTDLAERARVLLSKQEGRR